MGLTHLQQQSGMTLVECLVSLIISVLVLSGLMHMLDLTVMSYASSNRLYEQRTQAQSTMRRIERAVAVATPKKKELLDPRDTTSSGTWFYGAKADGTKIKITYAWSSANQVLNEIDDSGIPRAILSNVTDFSVTAPQTNDATLVAVSLTVSNAASQFTLRETMRLGGIW